MRLALITVSAIALSGCTWFGGGAQSGSNGFNGQASAHCGPQGGYTNSYNQQAYQGQGCGAAGGYSVNGGQYAQQGAGYGQAGYAQGAQQGTGYTQAGYGQGVQQQGAGYGYGYTAGYAQGYGNQVGPQGLRGSYGQQATTLGATAPYGAAVGGQYGGANVQTVQGAPIYVQQPYAAYGNAGCAPSGFNAGGCGVVGAAQPFGIEAGIGTDFDIGGDIFQGREELDPSGFGLATDGLGGVVPGTTRFVSAQPSVSYNDAFDEAVQYDLAATYDVGPNTTVLGRVGYSEANGNSVDLGQAFDTSSATAGTAATAVPVTASFSDLEQYTVEGGVRQYVGGFNNGLTGIRPYVGATAGVVYTDDVNVTQTSAVFAGPETQEFIDSGWQPTAAAVVGAEWQVANSFAVGVESGIRWSDDLDTVVSSEDRWSIPVRIRGRVSF